MMRVTALVVSLVFLPACGGGSGGSNGATASGPVSGANICAVQDDFFSQVAGRRTGQLHEAVLASDVDSFCEFDVELVINNDPDPTRNCELTGRMSYVGTQLVVDAGNAISCDSDSDVMVRLGQSVAVMATIPAPIEPPISVLLFVESERLEGPDLRAPFITQQVVTMNADFSIQVDDQTLSKVESGR